MFNPLQLKSPVKYPFTALISTQLISLALISLKLLVPIAMFIFPTKFPPVVKKFTALISLKLES